MKIIPINEEARKNALIKLSAKIIFKSLMGEAKRKKTEICPNCQSNKDVIRIIYGELTPEAIEQFEKGELMIGGCVIHEDSPNWHCKKCNIEFGIFDFDFEID